MTKIYLLFISIFIGVLLILVFLEPIQRSAMTYFDSLSNSSQVPATKPVTHNNDAATKPVSKKSSDALLTLITKDLSLLELDPLEVQYKSSELSDRIFLDEINSEIIDAQLLITPNSLANNSAFFKLMLGLGGEVVGINHIMNEYQVEFSNPTNAKALLDVNPLINSAVYNLVMAPQSVSEDPWQVDTLGLTFVDKDKNYLDANDDRMKIILETYEEITLNDSGQIRLYSSDIINRLTKISELVYKKYDVLIWSDLGAYIPEYGFITLDVMSESVIQSTNVDLAWQYADKMAPIKVGIVDIGIESSYKDVVLEQPQILNDMNVPDVIHGSHVLGIIAATHDNGIGIAGIGVNSVPYTYEWTDYASIKEGISKMFEEEVSIINLSIGLSDSVAESARLETQENASAFINKAFDIYKQSGEYLVVIGAGNVGVESSNYQLFIPEAAHQDNVIVVASASYNTQNDQVQRASHSCYGEHIDIYAPGEKILSVIGEDTYGISTGTSMAAPYVSGVASMIWGINPELSAAEVKATLLTTDKYLEVDGQNYPLINALLSLEEVMVSE